MRPPRFFARLLLVTLFISVFGAGIVDVLYNDVVPIRPYTGFFQANLNNILRATSGPGMVGDLLGVVIMIVLASSLFATIANLTTGRTIAHAGFTPNPNVTGTVGLVPMIQLIPFFFGAMILLMTYAIFERRLPGGL
ncbi:MAG TPA: hypothetical protein VF910_07735 [Candidatus Bathyarchaeia archaeon]